jgi:hypothetical protein
MPNPKPPPSKLTGWCDACCAIGESYRVRCFFRKFIEIGRATKPVTGLIRSQAMPDADRSTGAGIFRDSFLYVPRNRVSTVTIDQDGGHGTIQTADARGGRLEQVANGQSQSEAGSVLCGDARCGFDARQPGPGRDSAKPICAARICGMRMSGANLVGPPNGSRPGAL